MEKLGTKKQGNWTADGAGVLILFHVGLFCSNVTTTTTTTLKSKEIPLYKQKPIKPMLKTRVPAISRFE